MEEIKEERAGFEALSRILEQRCPEETGIYYGVTAARTLRKRETLDGVEVRAMKEPVPHWLYVTYGFSELGEKECRDLDRSGYGFELVFRLKKEEEEAPMWPMNLLQDLAGYVFSTGSGFAPGHYMDCGGPVGPEKTELTALAFRQDPLLGEENTVNGRVEFLEAVGITEKEMEGLMCWNGEAFLAEMDRIHPLGITDPGRSCLMGEESFCRAWEAGVEKDGSVTGFLYADGLSVRGDGENRRMEISAKLAGRLRIMLKARVGKDRSLTLESRDGTFCFLPGEEDRWENRDGVFHLLLTKQGLEEFCGALRAAAGFYPLPRFALLLLLKEEESGNRD